MGNKQSGDEIWPVYVALQKNIFIKKFYENVIWKLVPGCF